MDFLQQLVGIVVVLGALTALVVVARRRGLAQFTVAARSNRPKRMQVLERLSLTPQHSIHLVTVDHRTVLVGVSPGGCQLLESDSVATAQNGAKA